MKVLFAVSHYYKAIDANTRYASHSLAMRDRRRQVLDTLIFKIHQLFGPRHFGAQHFRMGLEQLPNQCALDFDIKICTTGGCHLIDDLSSPPESFEHVPTDAAPLFLGFSVQELMRQHRGLYDYYCYLEDDIIIHDPFFFKKLEFFNRSTPMEHLLQPQRFELSMYDGKVHKPYITKLYPDYQAREIPAEPRGYAFEVLGMSVNLTTTTLPHAGSFFLNAEQFEYLVGRPEFANTSGVDVKMALDLAATLAIMRNFTIFKPAGNCMGFFEVEHGCCNMLNQVSLDDGGTIQWRWSEKEFAPVDMEKMTEKEPQPPQEAMEPPEYLQGLHELEQGNLAEAAIAFRRTCITYPGHWEAWYRLGELLHQGRQISEAETCFRRVVELNPNLAEGQESLGIVLQAQGKGDEALCFYNNALQLDPESVKAAYNLATALESLERYEEAICAYRQVLAMSPDHAEARWYLAGLLLLTGQFEEGLREYEHRWEVPNFSTPKRDFTPPAWNGGDPSGKTILVHMEQGFGDMLQFVRYAPLLAEKGAVVIVVCAPELKHVMETVPGVGKVLINGDPWCHFDIHVPVMSLPYLFNTTLATIPANVPYIFTDCAKAARSSQKFAAEGLRVGLVWGGRQDNPVARERSCPPEELAQLAGIPGVTFYSLQVGESGASSLPSALAVHDFGADIRDFSDTAAFMEHLDLVISIDTAAAHLAGAMGKPVWLLLKKTADWRWLLHREDSPWYPSMRLFRQRERGEWGDVVQRVSHELRRVPCRVR